MGKQLSTNPSHFAFFFSLLVFVLVYPWVLLNGRHLIGIGLPLHISSPPLDFLN